MEITLPVLELPLRMRHLQVSNDAWFCLIESRIISSLQVFMEISPAFGTLIETVFTNRPTTKHDSLAGIRKKYKKTMQTFKQKTFFNPCFTPEFEPSGVIWYSQQQQLKKIKVYLYLFIFKHFKEIFSVFFSKNCTYQHEMRYQKIN